MRNAKQLDDGLTRPSSYCSGTQLSAVMRSMRSTMNSEMHPPDRWLSFGLAFVGGFGDAAGFVLAKTFTGHITGSLVLGTIAIAARDWPHALEHYLATAFFLAGIPVTVLITRLTLKSPSRASLPIVMAIEVILITAAYLVLAPSVVLFVICLSLALGLQNAALRRTGGISVHTNYLTGLITGLLAGEAESHAFPSAHHSSTTSDWKTGLLYGIWSMFLLGAVAGAAIVFRCKERGLLAAVPILIVLIVRNLTTPQQEDSPS